jgi:hypothetical protein
MNDLARHGRRGAVARPFAHHSPRGRRRIRPDATG